MRSRPLPNYLEVYRKRIGFTQTDMAFLLGGQDHAQFSRYEKRHLIPSLRTALAFEVILKQPVAEIFAGIRDSVAEEIQERMQMLIRDLDQKAARPKTAMRRKKLRWVAENHKQ